MTDPSEPQPHQSACFVVAIDGPAGAGKSTVAKELAQRLGFEFLDTGAMYRCVTYAVQRADVDPSNAEQVAKLAEGLNIELSPNCVKMNGEDVSKEIRTPEVAKAIGSIADNVDVRKVLSATQRRWADGKCVVTEGRDQGTEVFFDSPCKVYLYATSEERARRRQIELSGRGIDMTFEEVLAQQNQRDADDMARPVGALRKAEDAMEFCTDGIELSEVIRQLEQIIRKRMQQSGVFAQGQANS